MPEKTRKQSKETSQNSTQIAKAQAKEKFSKTEISFVCKFCGEKKPLKDMVMMRQYYPQVPSCKECAKDRKKPLPEESVE